MSRTSHLIFGGNVTENKYRKYLEEKLYGMFPGCLILRNNAKEVQGIPDIVIFYGHLWAMLEIKVSEDAPVQPNQPYYVEWLSSMGFASFIYPENEFEVLSALVEFFEPRS